MKLTPKARNMPMDAGLIILALSILSGFAVLLLGHTAGKYQHARHHAEGAPSTGQVPADRHQNISGPAAR